MEYEILKYNISHKQAWDSFIDTSKNSSFLFKRDFIEYHSDKFYDYSLMIYYDSKLKAIIPSNLSGRKLVSHQGLSYGGIILSLEVKLTEVIEIVKEVLKYLQRNGIERWLLKNIPRIYHHGPCDELDWILFKLNANLYRRDTALVIDNRIPKLPYQKRRTRAIKKAAKNAIEIKEGFHEIIPFWNDVLIPNLLLKHSVLPVHTLSEIQFLASSFPKNIKQYNIYLNQKIVAGCTLFINSTIVHAQYISGSKTGRETGCLDYLFDYLIQKIYFNFTYFDFGICNEDFGQKLNVGLLDWKEGFGARTIVHDFYDIDTSKYFFLENCII